MTSISTGELLLGVSHLDCGYGSKLILSDISFDVCKGEIIALLGPNGSGKSTLLKTLCGTIRPLSGEIELLGENLKSLKSKRLAQLIGYVPQDEEHSFGFSVREVVLMGRLPYADSLFESPNDHEIAERAMQITHCNDLADSSITEISGGERQRVLIARALAQEPQCLLLDEPNNHLDVRHVMALRTILRDLAKKDGIAMVAAVHDLNFASILADRVIVLNQGAIVLAGNTADVLENKELDSVYGVEFHREKIEGSLRIFPIF